MNEHKRSVEFKGVEYFLELTLRDEGFDDILMKTKDGTEQFLLEIGDDNHLYAVSKDETRELPKTKGKERRDVYRFLLLQYRDMIDYALEGEENEIAKRDWKKKVSKDD